MTTKGMHMNEAVLEINVTDFKAKCLSLFKDLEARRYDKLVVTRRGKPIAQLTPAETEMSDPYGCLAGRAIVPSDLDLTSPILEDIPEAEADDPDS